ncbi:hypothetical protein DP939_02240 [Spongiactinospora rosea]|uniref:Holliday junction resolvase RusA-like endonuclease n=1 Tax=Spongiactinospora rosea TaxID=2248750 RepID=A0A366M741_9ACTN|nr:RusA family crossover junction endodeoxyribonuclease [Spongiactinospora rosea]RBQ21550.1 hypothetical protein DP939_02240 [Spongiactinospora rosea]
MTAPLITLTVRGEPAGQGNLKGTAGGKLRHANGRDLHDWRGRVRGAALDLLGAHEYAALGKSGVCALCSVPKTQHAELLGAVRLEAVVTVARPKTARSNWPITRSSSDWDHYGRAIGDALTGVTYLDDSQVVDGRCITTYPYVHELALGEPGAVIRLWAVT